MFGSKKPEVMPTKMVTPDEAPTLAKATKDIEGRYSREVWWISNQDRLRKVGITIVIGIEALMVLFGLWVFVDYYLFKYVDEQKMIGAFLRGGELASSVRTQAPADILVREPILLSSGKTFDILTFVKNPNPNFVARITYHFQMEGKATEARSVNILHGSETPVAEFGVEGGKPRSAGFIMDNVEWSRINPKIIPYPVAWKEDRLGFKEKEIAHDPAFKIGGQTVGRTTFTLTNATGFGYREVDLYIVLKRGGAPVGVNRTVVTNINPLEEKFVQIDWFSSTSSANQVDIYPIVDIFDPEAYLASSAETPKDRRDLLERRR